MAALLPNVSLEHSRHETARRGHSVGGVQADMVHEKNPGFNPCEQPRLGGRLLADCVVSARRGASFGGSFGGI